jgi:NAD(P)-dependent dehydrogenase (short-subunit alcohol dehydrogenase family)
MDPFDVSEKVVIVTGGGAGLGKEIARAFVQRGSYIVIVGRRESALEETMEEFGGDKEQILTVKADVTKRDEVDSMTDKVLRKFGRADVLINNAGVNIVKPFLELTETEWDTVIDTSLKGLFNCCQAIGRGMVEKRSGTVINMTSVFGLVGLTNISHYVTSRGGIVQFTKALAIEWGRKNIRVNAIAPSYIRAGQGFSIIESDPNILQMNLRNIPMRRGGEPNEVATTAIFLASEAASFITGTTILVDGGWTAW